MTNHSIIGIQRITVSILICSQLHLTEYIEIAITRIVAKNFKVSNMNCEDGHVNDNAEEEECEEYNSECVGGQGRLLLCFRSTTTTSGSLLPAARSEYQF
jgi:hypothetical protein